jgi:cell division protease FtsH
VAQSTNMSDETAKIIDEEVRKLIEHGETEARRLITKHRKDFIAIAEALLEYETLSGDEIKALIKGVKPTRDDGEEPQARGSAVPKSGKSRKRKDGEPDTGMEPQPQG